MPKTVPVPPSPFPPTVGRNPTLRQPGQRINHGRSRSKCNPHLDNGLPCRKRLLERICDKIAAGHRLADICKAGSMPSERVWFRWVSKFPAVRALYDAARRARLERLQESVLDAAYSLKEGTDRDDVRVQIAATVWLADRLERALPAVPAPMPPKLSPMEVAAARRAKIDAALARRREKKRAAN